MDYNKIKEQVKEKLPNSRDFKDTDNLLELGLSSLVIMRLVNQWRKQGIKVPFGALMEHPTFESWWKLIQNSAKKNERKNAKSKKMELTMPDMKQDFPLSDVQYAYWVGRVDGQPLGGIGCHAYLEFDGKNVDPDRLQEAWNKVQYHHPMLRACFLSNGMQKIQDRPFSEKIKVNDFSSFSESDAEIAVLSIRDRLSHRKLKVDKGEVAGVELTILPQGKSRVHIDVDLLVADVQSLHILLRDLATAYSGKNLPSHSKEWNYAAYLKKQEIEDGEEKEQAKRYWNGRLKSLPKGPELPLAKRPEEVQNTVFNRRIVKIGKNEWETLQNRAKAYKTTPAMLLLTAYSIVLERWSRNKRFLINIPYFNRKTEIQGLEDVIADFTTLLLLEVNCEGAPTFLELLHRIEKQIHEDMKYTAYSGVQVQRDLSQMNEESSVSAPVVFACNLGTPLVDRTFRKCIGEFSYMISQTPQVWNDFQSYEDETGVQLTWDSVDELFPEHMVQDMMDSFEVLLHKLGRENWDQKFDVLPENRKNFLETSYKTGGPEKPQCLHWAFLESAEKYPQKIALIDSGKAYSITYDELKNEAFKIAYELSAHGINKVPVAVTLPRGYEQIVAVLGILISGNSYVPVSENQPKERRKLIHKKTGVNYVITNNEWKDMVDWPDETEVFVFEKMNEKENVELPEVFPEDSAYIIMTSGSTGVPKGVEIAHGSAWNTIQDINTKYHISEKDTTLAVSAMDFDLSVYDVFGILGVGGTLVLLPERERRNADFWLEQIRKHHITVWNSVPVLLDMLLIRAEALNEKLSLRTVLLSGDWIGMDLPERLAALTDSCKFVALGGATEASIWSNYQNVILPIPTCWKSIPYGRPLEHQTYRVVDEYGRDCPFWTEGELWIGGYGVAKGYRGDPILTEQKFISDSYGRWYRTGDLGRFWQDGTIEFLGRKDHQVKIRGHRIELGEIEHAIRKCKGVNQAVVDTFNDSHKNKSLVAYVGAPLEKESEVVSWITDEDRFQRNWSSIIGALSTKSLDREKEEAYKKFMTCANQYSLKVMTDTLEDMGILTTEKGFSLEEKGLMEEESDNPQKSIITHWLRVLERENIYENEQNNIVMTEKPINIADSEEWIKEYFQRLQPYLIKMLNGKENPLNVFYEKEPLLAPVNLLSRIPGHEDILSMVACTLKKLCSTYTGYPLQILEIGTRDSNITRRFMESLENVSTAYTYADTSKYFLQETKKELEEFEGIEYEILDLNKSLEQQWVQKHRYDIVISVNALHRNHDVADAVEKISELMKPNGVLLMTELVDKTYLQEITAAFLEDGFSSIMDRRKEMGIVMPDYELWKEYLEKAELTERFVEIRGFGRVFFCCRQKKKILDYDIEKLRERLSETLPEYMIPQNYHFMEQLPTLSNGKINRKSLKEDFKGESAAIRFTKATTVTERKLMDIWKRLLGYTTLSIEDNYFAMGGDSLVATRLISEIQKEFECEISIGAIFENPTIKALAKVIDQTEKEMSSDLRIKPDIEKRFEPFPLTDVQYAYWIGRSGLYDLGNVATHCYFELDAQNLDVERVGTAWNSLIKRHGMMRAVILTDGTQKILENVPEYQIQVLDVRKLDKEEKEKALQEKRDETSQQVIDTENWPLFDVKITKITDDQQRIHISFDNIIFDGWSMFHILNEWAEIYEGGQTKADIKLSFRDYVLGLEQIKKLPVFEKDRKYWIDRIEGFSPAPDLPLAKNEKQITDQRFCRRSAKLSPKEWDKIRELSGEIGVTPSVLLICAYAETLRLWSNNKDFTLNLTQFDRKQMHPEVSELIGDFTTLTLLEIHDRNGESFQKRAKAIQKQLFEDMEHSAYSAIELERELKKKQGNQQGSIMPIVFTSGLGIEQWNEGKWLGKLHYNISQTPQVWLDHQVVEMDGGLCLFWDSVDELFYPGMLDEMFDAYTDLLKRLAKNPGIAKETSDSLVSAEISEVRLKANEMREEFEEKTLDELFWEASEKWPEKEALVTSRRRMTYREIREEALYIVEQLRKEHIKKGETVAILMEKGWEQIVATFGILFAGAAYLPIDLHNPQERIEKILHDSNTKTILVQPNLESDKKKWLTKWSCISVSGLKCDHEIRKEKNEPGDLAYVIYTSGTTGMPKGVMITHHNASNTIMDINHRFQVTEQDIAFGISNLHFDLSVYDIFGILGAGGKIIIPDADRMKDPGHWIELLNSEGITIWNSVPAFMEMLVEYEEYQKLLKSQTLRLILMSGDWIPVSLPDRIRHLFSEAKIVALGGATEASIWSNSFEIPDVIPQNWKSIPYGKPLANQRYYVLDQNMKNCPDWVTGTLYIAGEGVALGYLNDEEQTKEKFIIWKETGERLYCTGDMGRYWSNGNIEFLGRLDNQVKINGYRVELGEIETSLLKIPGIMDTTVLLEQSEGILYAIMTENDKYHYRNAEFYKEALRAHLPSYMIPSEYVKLESIPLTENGKRDIDEIRKLIKGSKNASSEISTEQKYLNLEQLQVLQIWRKILGNKEIGIHDNFFDVGGNSLQAVQLINEMMEALGRPVEIGSLFDHPTVDEFIKYLSEDIK